MKKNKIIITISLSFLILFPSCSKKADGYIYKIKNETNKIVTMLDYSIDGNQQNESFTLLPNQVLVDTFFNDEQDGLILGNPYYSDSLVIIFDNEKYIYYLNIQFDNHNLVNNKNLLSGNGFMLENTTETKTTLYKSLVFSITEQDYMVADTL